MKRENQDSGVRIEPLKQGTDGRIAGDIKSAKRLRERAGLRLADISQGAGAIPEFVAAPMQCPEAT